MKTGLYYSSIGFRQYDRKVRVIHIDDDQLDITQTSSEDIMNSSLPVKQSVR